MCVRKWTGLEFAKSQRAVEDREKWRKLVAKSSMVPQWPSWLRARWDDNDEMNSYQLLFQPYLRSSHQLQRVVVPGMTRILSLLNGSLQALCCFSGQPVNNGIACYWRASLSMSVLLIVAEPACQHQYCSLSQSQPVNVSIAHCHKTSLSTSV